MILEWGKYGIDVSKVTGTRGATLCPQCSAGRKPQHQKIKVLTVDLTTGKFTCQHCGWDGWATTKEKPMYEQKEYKKPEIRPNAVSIKAIEWFKSRGISNETLLSAKVSEAREYIPQVSAERNCICFNYYRDNDLVNIKFRDGKKNFKLVSQAELIFYNLNSIVGRSEAIITEGEMDCLSLMEIGLTNVISVPNGASKGNQKLLYLDNCIDNFNDKERIILATDTDEAGLSLRAELIRRLGAERCYLVKYPEDCKDANDVLLKHGKEVLRSCIGNAKQSDIEGIVTVHSLRDKIFNIANNGYPSVLPIEFIGLNELIKWRGGELTVITGIPSHGKSEFLDQISLKLACQHKWRFAVFSPENQPEEVHVIKLAEKLYGANLRDIPTNEIEKCISFLNDHFFFLAVDENDTTVEGILAKCAELVKRYGINAVVIDPWNTLTHSREKGKDKSEYISESLSKMTAFCLRYNVHMFLVAHPTKMQKDLTTKKHNVPTLYDISDSAHFYNKAFNGICVYRNFDTDTVDVHVQKVKFKWVGKVGSQPFVYDAKSGRYSEMGDSPKSDMYYLREDEDNRVQEMSKRVFKRIAPKEEKQATLDLDIDPDTGQPYPF